jgi:small multidrug resistance pump
VALIAYLVVYTALGTIGLMLLRRSLAEAPLAELVRDPTVLTGALFYAASFTTFLASLRRFDVLLVFPLFTGATYAAVTIAAAVVLDESLNTSRLAGIALVAAGAVLLVR